MIYPPYEVFYEALGQTQGIVREITKDFARCLLVIRALEARISADFWHMDLFADGDYNLYVETLFRYLKDVNAKLRGYWHVEQSIRVQVDPDILGQIFFLGSGRSPGHCSCTEDMTMFDITYTLEPNEYNGLVLDGAFKRKAGL